MGTEESKPLTFKRRWRAPAALRTTWVQQKGTGILIDRTEGCQRDYLALKSLSLANAIGIREDREEEQVSCARYRSRAFLACLIVTIGVTAHSILESVALGAGDSLDMFCNLHCDLCSSMGYRNRAWDTVCESWAGLAAGPIILLVFVFSFVAPIGVGLAFLLWKQVTRRHKLSCLLWLLGLSFTSVDRQLSTQMNTMQHLISKCILPHLVHALCWLLQVF